MIYRHFLRKPSIKLWSNLKSIKKHSFIAEEFIAFHAAKKVKAYTKSQHRLNSLYIVLFEADFMAFFLFEAFAVAMSH